jgi:ABC-type branched-subunit amino acid transport system ATPase component
MINRRMVDDSPTIANTVAPMLWRGGAVHHWNSLKVIDVSKTFGGTLAVSGASLEVERGRIVGLIGPNGSGKTTLLNLISGVISQDSGAVKLDGVDISSWKIERRARAGIARTFQNLRLFQRLSVLENVAVAVAATRAASDIFNEARGFLDLVGLGEASDALASTLPYADQRRLELARALAGRPSFVLVDEPTAGMSDIESAALGGAVKAAVDRLECGVLCVAHDLQLISQICHFVHVLQQGRVIATGSPNTVRSNPLVVDAYLGRVEEISTA